MQEIRVIDSHTAGEPTRLVLDGGPALGSGPLEERAARLPRGVRRLPFGHRQRAARFGCHGGSAAVSPRIAPDCRFGVIFFNNVGVLGMCGHGTIGLIASLAHLGKLAPGSVPHRYAGGRGRRGVAR